jgi:hypothetical protein
MSLDRPGGGRADSGMEAVRRELMGESAAALGRIGRRVVATLAELRAHGEGKAADPAGREVALYACAEAVWLYFVQREVCGLTNHDGVIAAYEIPREVLARVGASRPSGLVSGNGPR